MKNTKLKAITLALLASAFMLAACAPVKNADPSPSPKLWTEVPTGAPSEEPTLAPTEAPTEVPTEAPTEAPTEVPTQGPSPGVSCPPVSELNEHDYNAVRSFLEIKDENGVRNGEKMNEYYDPDDPTTWFCWGSVLHEAEGNVPIAAFNENGRLLQFYIPWQQDGDKPGYRENTFYDLVGKLDLSGCEELISVSCKWCGITALDVTGCNEPEIDVSYCEQLEEVLPETIEAFHISIYANKLRRLHWVSVPKEHEEFCYGGEPYYLNNFDFDLTVVADGDGNVGINNFYATDWSVTHFGVELAANWDREDENIKFLGWYDKDGKLVSSNHLMMLPMDEETGLIQGTFYYVAKFETLN